MNEKVKFIYDFYMNIIWDEWLRNENAVEKYWDFVDEIEFGID